ncbi:MAG: tetratricopeptide repeat protein [Candidatus Aminicenantes bacterium]|nr:MAG: tetratricopeptide repeat protein [Candidatus Aminicenantes bacterium]
MKSGLKKYVCWYALFVLISLLLFSETTLEKIEARLSKAQGKEKINLLLQLTGGYEEENPQKALKYGEEVLELLTTFPDKKARVSVLNNMSIAYRFIRDYKKAKEHAQSSLDIARKIKDKPGIARALTSLGRACLLLEEFDQARHYHSESVKLYEDLHDQHNLALAYNSIAGIHWRFSEYATAMEYLYKSLKIYEDLDHQERIGSINNNLGVLHMDLKNFDKSLEHYQKSLKIKEKLNNKEGMHKTLSNIGLIYSHKCLYDKSLKYFQRALKISKELGDNPFTSTIFLNIGDTYIKMKNHQLALENYNKSLKIKEKLNERRGMSKVLINKASVNLLLGKHQKAIQQALQGLDLAKQIKVKAVIRDAYEVLSRAYEAIGDIRSALDHHKKFKEIDDQIFADDTNMRIAGLETNFHVERKQKEIELLRTERENQRRTLLFLIIFALLILLLTFVIHTRYRLKARVTRALEKEIDERKLTEQKLRESEEKFRVLAEKSVVGIWIVQDNFIKYANPTMSKTFGYPREELIDKSPLELAIEEDRPLVNEQLIQRMAGSNGIQSYEFKGITKNGEILYLESYGALTLYQGQPAVLESIIDITRRKKTEAELIKSRKMESVGILAGGIAHDFNNLLAIIVGNTSMLKLTLGNGDSRLSSFLEGVEQASAQAADLAQKFITFSEGGWLIRKKVELHDILRDTAQLSPEINNIPCEIIIPPDLAPIYADERQLRQVITNLLLNAYEATSGNYKKVTIKAQNVTLTEENQFSLKNGKYVKILVIDKGRGIPPQLLEKIFDPYFSTKDTVSKKGLGMGLAICYSIVKKHEGHIAIDSEPKKGTTVEVYLPAFEG